MFMRGGVLFIAVLSLAACGTNLQLGDVKVDEVTGAVVLHNGFALNGTVFNGTVFNGKTLNGIEFTGAQLSGDGLSNVTLSQTVFTANTPTGMITGTQLAGARFTGYVSDNGTINLRIDQVTSGPSPNSDLLQYAVSYDTPTGWRPLCGLDANSQAIPAWPVVGYFNEADGSYASDTSKFQFVCRGGAIAKCLEFGYRPWRALQNSAGTFESTWVACTRMVRADYCGDGTAHTTDGVLIDVADQDGLLVPATSWGVEAEWTSSGAVCVTEGEDTRWADNGLTEPSCWSNLRQSDCGASMSDSLILDRYQ